MKPRDPSSHLRSQGALRQRTVKPKRGKGSFRRTPKHKGKAHV